MSSRQLKVGYFTLEGINSFAATFYLYYLFFLARDEFGFTNRGNLFLTALHGLVYLLASWQGGRFAQRFGYFTALRFGFAGMALGLLVGLLVPGLPGQVAALLLWTAPLCLIWPTLEALVTEGEDFKGTARMVGIYNIVWSSTSALSYCIGGWLWELLGRNGLYGLPLALMAVQFGLTVWLERAAKKVPPQTAAPREPARHHPESAAFRQPLPPRRFLQMAWLANPFAFVAMNTLMAVVPQLAERLQLTPAQAGVFCSLWFYARMGAFILLWQWTGWHYRFRWLGGAFCGLVAGFLVLVLARELWVLVSAQMVFGLGAGLIYYSSLFYSMDAGETKGEHGGLHEAAIGAGICGGPAIGAAALTFVPQVPHAGIYAVTALLLAGGAGLAWLRVKPVR